ncbi:MAG TPA: ABC transporter substrate-binding protein [Chloroflexota bacterium]|nr:ABC transporter substrate-binding protein [Chloroflexota bacterium]
MGRYRVPLRLVGLVVLLAMGGACAPAAPSAPAPAAPAQPAASAPTAAPAAAAATAVPTAAPQPATVRVGILNSVGDAAFSIGIEKGFYAEQGITVETVPFDSAVRMIAPLGAGQLEVGQGVIGASALNAVARGVDVRGIAGASGSPPGHGNNAFILRKDLADQVHGPADLRGRKVGIASTGNGVEIELVDLLQRGGLTLADVELVQLNFGEQVIALSNGGIDLALISEPSATLALDRGVGQLWMRSDELIPNHLTSFIWAGPHFVAQTDVAQRFMVAALKGVRLYNDAFFKNDAATREELIDIFTKYTPVKDRDLYNRMVFQGFDPDGRINRESVERDMAYYVATGQIPGPVDLDRLIDMRFADYAVSVLGPYPR